MLRLYVRQSTVADTGIMLLLRCMKISTQATEGSRFHRSWQFVPEVHYHLVFPPLEDSFNLLQYLYVADLQYEHKIREKTDVNSRFIWLFMNLFSRYCSTSRLIGTQQKVWTFWWFFAYKQGRPHRESWSADLREDVKTTHIYCCPGNRQDTKAINIVLIISYFWGAIFL